MPGQGHAGYNNDMNRLDWYNSLAKPTWTPAPSTIGLIWQILYPITVASFGFVLGFAVKLTA